MRKSKKIFIALVAVIGVFGIANLATYVVKGNTVFDFFTEEKMDQVWDLLQEDGTQMTEVDGYQIKLERYLYDKPACAGYALFSVEHAGRDMRKEFGKETESGTIPWFGDGKKENEGRFFFLTQADTHAMIAEQIVKVEKTEEKMLIYYKFEVNTSGTMDDTIYLCDNNIGEYAGLAKNAIFKFCLNPKEKTKEYILIDNERKFSLQVSPFVINIKGKENIGTLKDLVMILENGTRIDIIKNNEIKYGDYYVIGFDDDGYHCTIRINENTEDVVDISKIDSFEYDKNKLKEDE